MRPSTPAVSCFPQSASPSDVFPPAASFRPVEWLGSALPSYPRCRPKPGSASISRRRSVAAIADTAPVSRSILTTLDRNRENAASVGIPSRRGLGNSTTATRPSASRSKVRTGGRCQPKGSKPHTSSSAGLRRNSRSSDAADSCPNTTPATSARHIARTG